MKIKVNVPEGEIAGRFIGSFVSENDGAFIEKVTSSFGYGDFLMVWLELYKDAETFADELVEFAEFEGDFPLEDISIVKSNGDRITFNAEE